jgi:hypothetical protein
MSDRGRALNLLPLAARPTGKLKRNVVPDWEPIAGQSSETTAPTVVRGAGFPEPVPDCTFPKWPVGDGETRKIASNEWPLSGARIASLNDRVWATAEGPLPDVRSPLLNGAAS